MDAHSIERTSPKGDHFIGYCTKCGKDGLLLSDMQEECANPGGITQDEALIAAIVGPTSEGGKT